MGNGWMENRFGEKDYVDGALRLESENENGKSSGGEARTLISRRMRMKEPVTDRYQKRKMPGVNQGGECDVAESTSV